MKISATPTPQTAAPNLPPNTLLPVTHGHKAWDTPKGTAQNQQDYGYKKHPKPQHGYIYRTSILELAAISHRLDPVHAGQRIVVDSLTCWRLSQAYGFGMLRYKRAGARPPGSRGTVDVLTAKRLGACWTMSDLRFSHEGLSFQIRKSNPLQKKIAVLFKPPPLPKPRIISMSRQKSVRR